MTVGLHLNLRPFCSTSDHHPRMVNPDGDSSVASLHEYLTRNRTELARLLLRHGGILFRGFGLQGPDDFRASVESLGGVPFTYVGGNTPRSRVARDVFTSTEFPPTEVIPAHNEMSYLPTWPRRVLFYALLPAASGGETPLTSGRDVLSALPESVVRRFREKRVTYIRHFQPNGRIGKSWQATYETSDRAELEAIIREQGSTLTWLPNGVLRVRTTCEAIVRHPETGEEVWFNQAEQWHPSALASATREMFEQLVGKGQMPHDCEYGDGDPLEDDVLAVVRDGLCRHKLLFAWQPHDLLMLDNVLMMHGREPYTGPRKTLAYLSAI